MKEHTQQGARLDPNPLVTIWTSCYNHEKYLDDYFQGLLSQTYSNIQLILIDDGSTDGSWEKICSYEHKLRKKFPLVFIERHENIGPTEEFLLHFFKHAAGEYICMLESDDYYLPTKIEENVRYFQEHHEFGAVHSEVDYIYNDRIEHCHWSTSGVKIPQGDVFEELLVNNFIMTVTFCCRMDLFKKYLNWQDYLAKGYIVRDYACYLDLARHTPIGYINKSLARYRVLQNSFAHSTNPHKTFQLLQNYHRIRLDYIQQYGAPDWIHHLALQKKHLNLFESGYNLYLREQFWEGYAWLLQNCPLQYKTVWNRIRALSMRNKVLWRLIHKVDQTQVIQRIYRTLRRLLGNDKSSHGVTASSV